MREFKGTAGEWKAHYHDTIGVGTSTPTFVICDCELDFQIPKEQQIANAKLIALAPAMFDFINRLSGEMLRNDFVLNEKWHNQAVKILNKLEK